MLFLVRIVAVAALWSTGARALPTDDKWSVTEFKSFVLFGDSYSDEQRVSYFQYHDGKKPPVGWIEEEVSMQFCITCMT